MVGVGNADQVIRLTSDYLVFCKLLCLWKCIKRFI